MQLKDFDEAWYLEKYPDVASNVRSGRLRSGRQHYIRHGFREGRLGSAQMTTSGSGTKPQREMRPHSVEALCFTPNGDLFFNGWVDDGGEPLTSLTIEYGRTRVQIDGKRLRRARRSDVEEHVDLPYSGIDYGAWAFFLSPKPTKSPSECTVSMRAGAMELASRRVKAQHVTDVDMRDIVLSYFAKRETVKNVELASARDMDAGLGAEIVELNRRILRDHRQVTTTRFNGGKRDVTKSVITCLYGSPELLPLQVALFSRSERFADVEFVYINNSPEHAEFLQRQAKQSARLYDVPITLIHAEVNLGFAAANNVAATHAASNRLLFVNPDVLPKEHDWLVKHDEFSRSEGGTFFGACLYYDDGSVMHAGMHLERDTFVEPGEGTVELLRVEHYAKGFPDWAPEARETRIVPAVTGAFMSIDRSHFERLGGFSEDYIFGHYEDADLCLRSAAQGEPVWYCADVKLWHMEGKGSVRRPVHEGASKVNRWRFAQAWGRQQPQTPGA
jgi:GT2 family glycosyltransferase